MAIQTPRRCWFCVLVHQHHHKIWRVSPSSTRQVVKVTAGRNISARVLTMIEHISQSWTIVVHISQSWIMVVTWLINLDKARHRIMASTVYILAYSESWGLWRIFIKKLIIFMKFIPNGSRYLHISDEISCSVPTWERRAQADTKDDDFVEHSDKNQCSSENIILMSLFGSRPHTRY